MHASIGAAVVVDLDVDNVFVYDNDQRDPMKSDDVAYYGFGEYLDVYKSI